MRVLLINPPSPVGMTFNREGSAGFGVCSPDEGAFLYPPHTLATCASILRDAGYVPMLIDATAERLTASAVVDRLRAAGPKVFVVYVSYCGWSEDTQFCRLLRDQFPGVPLIAIGTALRVPACAQEWEGVVDLALIGEPEQSLPVAVEAMKARIWGGSVFSSYLAPDMYDEQGYLREVESLPWPAWDLVPVDRYPALTILSSRGCDHRCIYCPYIIGWGGRFRACSPARTVDELQGIHQRFQPRRVMFRDPVFAREAERVIGICEEIIRRKLSIVWECESRPEHFHASLLQLMKRAGCATVKIGLESAHIGRLVALGRVATTEEGEAYLEAVRQVVHTCSKIGLRCHVFVMTGWPDETEEEIETTVQFLQSLPPAHLSVKRVQIYPLTPCAVIYNPAGDSVSAERSAERLRNALASPLRSPVKKGRRVIHWLRRLMR